MASQFFSLMFFALSTFILPIISAGQNRPLYQSKASITFLDGTPANGLSVYDFKVKLVSGPPLYSGDVTAINGNTLTFEGFVRGTFQLTYLGIEVVRFTVSEKNGALTSDLPTTIHLPFNYLIYTDKPNQKVFIYDKGGKWTETITSNGEKLIFLDKSKNYVSTHFFVRYFKDGFPQILNFYEQRTKYNNEIRFRKFKFSSNHRSLKDAGYNMLGKNTVHNIDNDIYYGLREIKFNTDQKEKRYTLLLTYDGNSGKSSIHLLDINGYDIKLYLDEKGNPVLSGKVKNTETGKEKTIAYDVDKTGNLKPADNLLADNFYWFDGNIISGRRWEIPVFLGEPLTQGMHTVVASCETKDGKSLTSQVTFEVFFSPERNKFLYKNQDGSVSDYPDYIDHSVDFNELSNIKQCYLSVDGDNKTEFTHKSSEMAKGIFYSDMTEEEKKKAVENIPLDFGWDEDAEPYDYGIDLFGGSKFYSVGALINKKTGPLDNLKYSVTKITGEYPTLEEAKKHCKNPEQHRGYRNTVYRCLENSIVSVCLDNFRYKNTDKGKVVDYDALYCGAGMEENKKGDQIIYNVSAPGYASFSGALKKRSLQASEFTLTGKILGNDSIPIQGAKITFEGIDGFVLSDSSGNFAIKRAGDGHKPYSQNTTILLKKIGVDVFCDDLGSSVKDTFGIVSDGFTTLKLKVKVSGINPRTVIAKQPSLGAFVRHTMLNLALVVDEDGTGTMEYVPPLYLTNDMLNKHIPLQSDAAGKILSPLLWVAEVPVTITYEDEEGNPGKYTFLIRVTRPPVMLVHGFTGNEQTWETLANYLRTQKYEPVVREYYKGPADESTIERQSEKLGKYIQEVRAAYKENNFLQKRVDIVAHSMGGLISRYYISNMARYGKAAGIYIPYDVKLSHDELKANRFKKPVILNDVRKLIMVGTPNHGASWIDERLGYWAARNQKYHQIASAQLRNDSRFFKILNEGESEGRHLDTNVQYAILYGIRKRSALYLPDSWFHTWGTSQKEFAGDDGVVTVSSAKLNGVKDYPFPKDWFAKHGYIHSPAIQDVFPGDSPITESENIFQKITELLQKDIPRVPLKKSSSKIIRAEGIVKYRYFSTQNWVPVRTPIHSGNSKKLVNNWCRIKTEAGSATLGFFIDGHQWGMLHIMPNTIAYYEYASPEFVNIYMQQGKARFISRKKDGGGFEIVLGQKSEQWYAFNPKAKVKDLNTDFTVEADKDSVVVQSINGFVAVGSAVKGARQVKEQSVGKLQGLYLSENGKFAAFKVPQKGWWSSVDTAFLPDDTTALYADTAMANIKIGKMSLTASDKYLPPGGFVTLNLHIDSLPDTLIAAGLTINNSNNIKLVNISNPEAIIDSAGNARFNVTIREPSGNDFASPASIPLQVTFKAAVTVAGTEQVIAEKELEIPMGMILFSGKTSGPDFKPRNEIAAPDLFPVTYQILNKTGSKGEFYILFNYALYQKEIEKKQQYAKRTGSKFDSNSLKLTLKWPDNCSIPLKYDLPDSVLKALKPGIKIMAGAQGNFDLLTPQEHEQRIKKYVEAFAVNLPLNEESKSYLFSKLDNLTFNYNAKNVSVPSFSDNLNYKTVIDIPMNKQAFWGENLNTSSEPAYALVFHVMGHLLHQVLVLNNHRYYNFLAEKCGGSKYLYNRQTDELKYLFDKAEYVSFNEAGADFFVVLLYNYLKNNNPSFFENSVYSHKGYVDDFTGFNKFKTVQEKYPARLVSGPQTAFLTEYYGDSCTSNPAWVYHDFLSNMLHFASLTRGTEPASVMNQWILSKHLVFAGKTSKGSDPNNIAAKYGLLRKNKTVLLIPRTDFSKAELVVDNTPVTGFNQIPAVTVSGASQIEFGKGHFVVFIPSADTILMLEADSASALMVKNGNKLNLLSGTFFIDAPIEFNTALAAFYPTGNNIAISVSPKQTLVFNKTGILRIVSEKDEVVVPAGFATIVSKKGKIKKPKPPKKKVPERFIVVTGNE